MPFGIFYIFRVQNSTLLPLDKGHFITGNGFIRSEGLMNIRGSLNGEWSVSTKEMGLLIPSAKPLFRMFLSQIWLDIRIT